MWEQGGEDDKKQNALAPLDLCKATVSAKDREEHSTSIL